MLVLEMFHLSNLPAYQYLPEQYQKFSDVGLDIPSKPQWLQKMNKWPHKELVFSLLIAAAKMHEESAKLN